MKLSLLALPLAFIVLASIIHTGHCTRGHQKRRPNWQRKNNTGPAAQHHKRRPNWQRKNNTGPAAQHHKQRPNWQRKNNTGPAAQHHKRRPNWQRKNSTGPVAQHHTRVQGGSGKPNRRNRTRPGVVHGHGKEQLDALLKKIKLAQKDAKDAGDAPKNITLKIIGPNKKVSKAVIGDTTYYSYYDESYDYYGLGNLFDDYYPEYEEAFPYTYVTYYDDDGTYWEIAIDAMIKWSNDVVNSWQNHQMNEPVNKYYNDDGVYVVDYKDKQWHRDYYGNFYLVGTDDTAAADDPDFTDVYDNIAPLPTYVTYNDDNDVFWEIQIEGMTKWSNDESGWTQHDMEHPVNLYFKDDGTHVAEYNNREWNRDDYGSFNLVGEEPDYPYYYDNPYYYNEYPAQEEYDPNWVDEVENDLTEMENANTDYPIDEMPDGVVMLPDMQPSNDILEEEAVNDEELSPAEPYEGQGPSDSVLANSVADTVEYFCPDSAPSCFFVLPSSFEVSKQSCGDIWDAQSVTPLSLYAGAPKDNSQFLNGQSNMATLNICEAIKKAEGGQWFQTKEFVVKKSFDCPDMSETCFFDIPQGIVQEKASCKNVWATQDQTPVTAYVGNPTTHTQFINTKAHGSTAAVCERTKKVGKDEWFSVKTFVVRNRVLSCDNPEGPCFFKAPNGMESTKKNCGDAWEEAADDLNIIETLPTDDEIAVSQGLMNGETAYFCERVKKAGTQEDWWFKITTKTIKRAFNCLDNVAKCYFAVDGVPSKPVCSGTWNTQDAMPITTYAEFPNKNSDFISAFNNGESVTLCEANIKADKSVWFALKTKTIEKAFSCPEDAEICFFEGMSGATKGDCNTAWSTQDVASITSYTGNPLDNTLFTQTKVNGETVTICERIKKAGKNEWFKVKTLQVITGDFNCPENSENCFFEAPIGIGTSKKPCIEKWTTQLVTPFAILTGNPKGDNEYLHENDVGNNVEICERIKKVGKSEWFKLIKGTVAIGKVTRTFEPLV